MLSFRANEKIIRAPGVFVLADSAIFAPVSLVIAGLTGARKRTRVNDSNRKTRYVVIPRSPRRRGPQRALVVRRLGWWRPRNLLFAIAETDRQMWILISRNEK